MLHKNNSIRYQLSPQMKDYDKLTHKWVPHLMFTQKPFFRSKTINTDQYGLRYNSSEDLKQGSIFLSNQNRNNHLLLGSSSAFGVGSTNDQNTISALLSDNSDKYLNLGGRAFNGFQEIIIYMSLANKINNIKSIKIISGINDFYMHSHDFKNVFTGPFFHSNFFFKKMEEQSSRLINLDFFYNLFNNTKEKFYFPKSTLENTIERNLSIWKTIANGLNIKLFFFLQPFLYWCKKLSPEEIKLTNYIKIKIGKKDYLDSLKSIESYNFLKKIYEKKCLELKINFCDTNQFFKNFNEEWLFIDSIHMNDLGYKILSEEIKKWN